MTLRPFSRTLPCIPLSPSSTPVFFRAWQARKVHPRMTLRHGRHNCTLISRPASVPAGPRRTPAPPARDPDQVTIMGRSTVHYADSETNNILKRLHNKLRPSGRHPKATLKPLQCDPNATLKLPQSHPNATLKPTGSEDGRQKTEGRKAGQSRPMPSGSEGRHGYHGWARIAKALPR